ncbi:MAG: DUF357 domain-containing protein [Candidatus Aenigmatarchaeota archaeon]
MTISNIKCPNCGFLVETKKEERCKHLDKKECTVEYKLRKETKKWLNKIIKKRKNIELNDKNKNDLIKNIDAYISDSQYFLKKDDLINAFEAVIWSWAWFEILKELKIIKIK